MLRLNSKKMLMLDNGKPFSMSFTCNSNLTSNLMCAFLLPYMWNANSTTDWMRMGKVSFDITLSTGMTNGKLGVYYGSTYTTISENLTEGTHRITCTVPNSQRFDFFKLTFSTTGSKTVTVSNIVMENFE